MLTLLVDLTVFVISACGLVYQLLAGAVASYLLGDSVTQFSMVVGVFLSALGLGAYLSRHVGFSVSPGRAFVEVGYAVSVVGGVSSGLLFLSFAKSGFFRPTLYAVIVATGTLVGLELPLLLRVLRRYATLRELAARALTVDYAGAVVGSLAFSLFLVPRLGTVRTALLFGMFNALAALGATWVLGPAVGPPRGLRVKGVVTVLSLAGLMLYADRIAAYAEGEMYPDPVIFARSTRYQRIVVTSGRGSMQLFLDGNLQFASVDEHRYHEALVHPAFSVAPVRRRVLVLGGGDGLAVREILRYPEVERITLVDIDEGMTELGRQFGPLVELNQRSLHSPRVRIVNEDAMVWLGTHEERYDVVIVDFPDPNNYSLGKLYTRSFYTLVRRHLTPDSVVVVQSTSPLMARRSFWCVVRTIESAGLRVLPYHVPVPSFGEWGYVLASLRPIGVPSRTLPGLRYLNDALLPTLFVFSEDMSPVPVEINRLNNQVLVQYYEREWRRE